MQDLSDSDLERADSARTLLADALAAEVVPALRLAAIEPVVLKGPAIAARLYGEGERTYGDIDLLVDPLAVPRAERVLASLGLERDVRAWETASRVTHDAPWRRPGESVAIDLHRFLPGVERVSPAELWRTLARRTVRRPLPGTDITLRMLDDAGLALMIALHVAHQLDDDGDLGTPCADLDRAMAGLGPRAWARAGRLAARLRCSSAFARGVARHPDGAELLEELGRRNPFVRRASDRARRSPASPEPGRA